MPAPSFSQSSNFVYNQQAPLPEECAPGPKQEVNEHGDSTQFDWDEYVRAAGPAADQASSNQLLTRDVEAPDEQLQLIQKRSSSPDPIKNEHEEITQMSPHAISEVKQDNDSGLDPNTIDPRLFAANYDQQMSFKKSSS
jgi:hypothetical protein